MNQEEQYKLLVSTWSSGVASYHSLFSAYLTANSIFIAASILLAKSYLDNPSSFALAIISVCIALTGIFVSFQMAIALSRFSGQTGYFEWEIRGLEAQDEFEGIKVFQNVRAWRENNKKVHNPGNDPSSYKPNWAVKIHRFKYAARSKGMPVVFGLVQFVALTTTLVTYFNIKIV